MELTQVSCVKGFGTKSDLISPEPFALDERWIQTIRFRKRQIQLDMSLSGSCFNSENPTFVRYFIAPPAMPRDAVRTSTSIPS